jgi:hypothetical protein
MITIPPQEGSGPFGVAQKVLALTDEARKDPYAPGDQRRILLTAYVPVPVSEPDADINVCPTEVIPYMPPQTADVYGIMAKAFGLPNTTFGLFELEFCDLARTPPARDGKAYPVLIFSPGLTASRLMYAAHLRAVASRGYVILAVDHPHDAFLVEFPDGTSVVGGKIENNLESLQKALDVSLAQNLTTLL